MTYRETMEVPDCSRSLWTDAKDTLCWLAPRAALWVLLTWASTHGLWLLGAWALYLDPHFRGDGTVSAWDTDPVVFVWFAGLVWLVVFVLFLFWFLCGLLILWEEWEKGAEP